MKTRSTSATNTRSSTFSSSGSSRASGGSSRGVGAGRRPERAVPGEGAATASKQTRKPSGSRLTGTGSCLGDAWRKRLTRRGERFSRPWDSGGPQLEGTPKERRRRPSGGPDSTQSAEQVTLTYCCLLVSTLVLETFGLIIISSAQSVTVTVNGGNALTDFVKYLIFAAVGTLGMVGVSRIPLFWFPRMAWGLLVLTIALQCPVFTPVGINVYGNRNWIQVPGVGTAQPSEFTKVAPAPILGTLVTWYANKHPRDRAWVTGWSGAGVTIASVLGGQDLGIIIVLVTIVAEALWMSGMRERWFALLGAGGIVMFAAASMLSASRRARTTAWIHPEGADPMGVGYQPRHGMWTPGTGGWLGVGSGSSRQKWGYLTQADSDYIFAVLGEEFGLVGTLVVVALFAVIGACCLRLAGRHTSLYVVITISAIGAWIVGQAIINMGVVIGVLPVLDVPFPLVSRGDTALVPVLLAIGVLLAFACHEPGAQEALSTSPEALRHPLAVIVPRRSRARDK